jgi:hypothetical protein
MTQPMYFIQGPKEVVMVITSFNDVRHIHLTDKHTPNVKPSWYGESIGHYEGDTLVVDTVGIDKRVPVDGFGTPHTEQLHVVERFRLIEKGDILEVNVHVEDPGAFTTPGTPASAIGNMKRPYVRSRSRISHNWRAAKKAR